MRISKSQKALVAIAFVLMLGTMACVRNLSTDPTVDEAGSATESAAETKDAAVQMTLSSLLSTATNEVQQEEASNTPEATVASPTETAEPEEATAEPTVEATAEESAVPSATETELPTATSEAEIACYVHRFVYDESYTDGTRVDPGQAIEKIWRLQNVGTCDWVNGNYQMVFVSGEQMGGASPSLIEFTVLAGDYANFTVNLTAPSVPGTYRGYWILETIEGEAIGWGPEADQSFYLEIQVRGDTPTPE